LTWGTSQIWCPLLPHTPKIIYNETIRVPKIIVLKLPIPGARKSCFNFEIIKSLYNEKFWVNTKGLKK
jgi:hypothetical protein